MNIIEKKRSKTLARDTEEKEIENIQKPTNKQNKTFNTLIEHC